MRANFVKWDDIIYICYECNQSTELKIGYDSEEVCYGHGQISSNDYEYVATNCCDSDYHRSSLYEYVNEEPFEAYEGGWIDLDELKLLLRNIKDECEESFTELVDAWIFKYGGVPNERSMVGKI